MLLNKCVFQFDTFAKKAVAFFKISHSSVVCLSPLRSFFISSSAGVTVVCLFPFANSLALKENDDEMICLLLEPVYDKKRPYYTIATKEQEKIACFVVRALATLEMILKDVHGDVVVRKHTKEDFVAALKLFECLIIPRYSGLVFERPLFQKYDEVEPLIQWNYITEA